MLEILKTDPRYKDLVRLSAAILVGQRDTFLTFANPETLRILEELGLEESREAFHVANYLYLNGFHDAENRDTCRLWNDRFYLAHKFGLEDYEKKVSAVCTIWNAKNGTFQWTTTHFGYDNAGLLKKLGIISDEESKIFTGLMGSFQLEQGLCERLRIALGISEDEINHAYLIDYNIGRREKKYGFRRYFSDKKDLFSDEE